MSFSRIAVFSLLALLAAPALPQTKTDRASVNWGPDLTIKKDGDFDHVFGASDEHIYMKVDKRKETFIQKMDINNKLLYSKLLPLKIEKDQHVLEDLVLYGDNILVFTSFFDKRSKSKDLYLRVFSADDMGAQGRMRKLATINSDSRRDQGSFSVSVSPDERTLLVEQQLPYDKKDYEHFALKVFDEDMQLRWEEEIRLPYMDKEFSVQRMQVTNDGSVVVVGKKFAEKAEARELRKDEKPVYVYHLLIYHGNGAAPEDHPIEVSDKFLHDLTVNVGDAGDIVCGGFYGLKGTYSTHGVFFLRLDQRTKQIVHSSFKEFEKDFITQYMTEKEEKKATKKADRKGEDLEMYNYALDDLVMRTDGGAVMVGEQYHSYAVTTCTTSPNGGQTCRTTYHYVYNDIIVVNIDPQGNIEWAAKVPKRQHTVNDAGFYSSYALAVKEDKIYIMFNDSGKNLFLTPGQKVEPFKLTGKEALITLATIDADGKVHREALLAPDRRDAITRPKSCLQLANDRLFLYAQRKKDYRFGSVVFQ